MGAYKDNNFADEDKATPLFTYKIWGEAALGDYCSKSTLA
jgi:hypothetical protein